MEPKNENIPWHVNKQRICSCQEGAQDGNIGLPIAKSLGTVAILNGVAWWDSGWERIGNWPWITKKQMQSSLT